MAFSNWWLSLADGNGTAIKGVFKTDNSARVDAPALVIQRSASWIIVAKFFSKLNVLFSMLLLE